ncbi:lysylphosphatidylglycerol synthase transmembrane domain-containing protein [Lactobacillus kefiranofaciens]|uniref:lysylphosphatidylglycerol synthase transmembrane domain-containing protein n=1 Tax=Lactobacillus kefiranofaciens TaxID=267818 RepID=UPI0006EE9DB4|nr:lysylphosphatidylglycerol synthase transmembrane domain-containing protein [Lactobacillus kefiranofaciens]KRL24555.1 integral membrane protein [Lactobacillus kefiranofaciens subsp. kefirgranum DSM 10550 = JCM 8572]MCJ2172931.1 flippase-like domain-containing protein [Lactobacillus kefiranofaciens]QNT44621.1 flippase-like domain-containing protein [Lactobacillus kefiranofaciens]
MNKKHLWGILIVLAISAFVLYTDLKQTPLTEILKAAHGLNVCALAMVFGLMLLSYVCEAGILSTLAKRKSEPKRSAWSFLRIPIIQALFNAITPMSTGGQPSQLAAMIQMGMEGGRSTSILLMKFIIYQVVVLFAYVSTIIFGFHMVMTKFAGLAIFIGIGFLIHVCSIAFLLAIMFAYRFTKNTTNWLMNLLARFINKQRVEKWRAATLAKIDTFYTESQKLKKEKKKLLIASGLTVLQLLFFYSIPFMVLTALNVPCSWANVTQMNIMIIMFMAIIPIPGASGGAEYSFQTLFSTFISSHGALILAMFIWRFSTYFFGMILGIFGWIFKPKKIKNLEK